MGPPGPLGQGWALCVCVSFRPHPKTMSQRMVYQTSHTASHHTHMETRTRTHTHKTIPVLLLAPVPAAAPSVVPAVVLKADVVPELDPNGDVPPKPRPAPLLLLPMSAVAAPAIVVSPLPAAVMEAAGAPNLIPLPAPLSLLEAAVAAAAPNVEPTLPAVAPLDKFGLGASQTTHCAASTLLLALHTSQVQPSFGLLNRAQQSVDKMMRYCMGFGLQEHRATSQQSCLPSTEPKQQQILHSSHQSRPPLHCRAPFPGPAVLAFVSLPVLLRVFRVFFV